jgi:glycosyltransferase involved in cell wall biosynthesis
MTVFASRNTSGQKDPVLKRALRSGYRLSQAATAIAARRGESTVPRVYYGGARAGDQGGPLVKIKRLRQYFPEDKLRFNLVYVLSNAPYLPSFALRALKTKGIPIVHNQNGVFYPAWFDGDWKAENARMALSYKLADHVFFQSDFCRRAAEQFLAPREGPWDILHNAVDTKLFSPGDESARATDAPFTVLITGKINHHLFYRIDSTLRGVARARATGLNARLRIAGILDASSRSEANRLAEDLGMANALDLSGPYVQSDSPDIYRSADVYITTKHNDPCPNAVIEALACGLPIIYSDTGGVPELVGPDAGVALPCAEDWERAHVPDATDIADALMRVAGDDGTMAATARRRAVERFDIANWIERHRQVFVGLLAEDR